MKNLGELLFAPKPGESPEVAAVRIDRNGQIFKAALNNQAGLELLRLLYAESHPMAPRFGGGRTTEDAAFLDGERSLIGLMWLNGTHETTLKP